MQEAILFSATTENYDQVVLQNSRHVPVLVLFWGAWALESVAMQETLEALAREFAGRFALAEVEANEHPELLKTLGVANLPALKVYRQGQIEFELEGQMFEAELRKVLRGLNIMHDYDRVREQAAEKQLAGDIAGAMTLLAQGFREFPGNGFIALDMVHIFLEIAEFEQARALFDKIPAHFHKTELGMAAETSLFFANKAMEYGTVGSVRQRYQDNENDFEARFAVALYVLAQSRFVDGMDLLLQLHRQAPEWNNEAARHTLSMVIEMLKVSQPDLSLAYRRKLANMLS